MNGTFTLPDELANETLTLTGAGVEELLDDPALLSELREAYADVEFRAPDHLVDRVMAYAAAHETHGLTDGSERITVFLN